MARVENTHELYVRMLLHCDGAKVKPIEYFERVTDVRPNIHGHWIDNGVINKWTGFEGKEIHEYQCSECGLTIYATELEIVESNFCTSCGADMREPKGEKGTE